MQSPKEKRMDKSEPFFMPCAPKRKMSSEIISEARHSLRILKTQRPFTPREDQRKLFGTSSSRTPENRPPSAFSLHACSFEINESRPVSGKRLSPLDHKPKLTASPNNEDEIVPSFPKPPVDPVDIKRVSSARARLFKVASQGTLLPDKAVNPEDFIKRLHSESSVAALHSGRGRGDARLSDLNIQNQTKEHRPTSSSNVVGSEIEKGILPKRSSSSSALLNLRNESEQTERSGPTLCPSNGSENKNKNRSGSGNGSRTSDDETEEEAYYWNTEILPILNIIEKADNDTDVDCLCKACIRLYKSLENGNMLGRNCKQRAILLKILYKLVDVGSDQLSLLLVKLILALRVTGKNLLNVCKLIFKISRCENNDVLFQTENILDSLLDVLKSEDMLSNSEALLYCLGAIKFLSGNANLIKYMLNENLLETLVQLMKHISNTDKESDSLLPISGNLLVQLTAILRNIADLSQSRPRFLLSGALSELCVILEQYIADKDVCTNVARILSKLSSYNDCCTALADCPRCFSIFLAVLNKHQKKQDLVVRIVFTLGNLTAKNNHAREQFYMEDGAISTLLSLFQIYYELDCCMKSASGRSESAEEVNSRHPKHPTDVEDVLIKLIRVLANISIHPSLGTVLSTNQNCVDLLIKVLEYKQIDECEELVINAAAAINNLSYYQTKHSAVRSRQLRISELLLRLLLSNNMEGILEAARVFGNLSQTKEIRDFVVAKNVYKFMIALLDSKNPDVCFSACGVLINVTVDNNKRTILREEGGIKKRRTSIG
ncbi:armadillo repeat-containing protein 2 isoform X2 [Protopterus annectens]|uniref:armadillo repeat-containing protein 2 isoform X2 n=1 Tax=Protopterus annectens TaxID=7888 RepID=UPI001CFB1DE4|nr:armadillo repeat-containing protein 2 isoform X2 [Protopterus annectens]